jgi:hypothetical protein
LASSPGWKCFVESTSDEEIFRLNLDEDGDLSLPIAITAGFRNITSGLERGPAGHQTQSQLQTPTILSSLCPNEDLAALHKFPGKSSQVSNFHYSEISLPEAPLNFGDEWVDPGQLD